MKDDVTLVHGKPWTLKLAIVLVDEDGTSEERRVYVGAFKTFKEAEKLLNTLLNKVVWGDRK